MDPDGEYVALCQDLGSGVKRMPLLSAVEASACAVSTLASANAIWICVQCEEYHHMADAAFACMWHEIGIRLYLFMAQWPAPFQVERCHGLLTATMMMATQDTSRSCVCELCVEGDTGLSSPSCVRQA